MLTTMKNKLILNSIIFIFCVNLLCTGCLKSKVNTPVNLQKELSQVSKDQVNNTQGKSSIDIFQDLLKIKNPKVQSIIPVQGNKEELRLTDNQPSIIKWDDLEKIALLLKQYQQRELNEMQVSIVMLNEQSDKVNKVINKLNRENNKLSKRVKQLELNQTQQSIDIQSLSKSGKDSSLNIKGINILIVISLIILVVILIMRRKI